MNRFDLWLIGEDNQPTRLLAWAVWENAVQKIIDEWAKKGISIVPTESYLGGGNNGK